MLTPSFMNRLLNISALFAPYNVLQIPFLVRVAKWFASENIIETISSVAPKLSPYIDGLPEGNKKSLIQCSFYGNQLLIAIPCIKDIFVIDQLVDPVSTDSIKVLLQQFNMIFAIIEELKLYQDIGL